MEMDAINEATQADQDKTRAKVIAIDKNLQGAYRMDKAGLDSYPPLSVESIGESLKSTAVSKDDKQQPRCPKMLITVQTRVLKRQRRTSLNRTLISLVIISYIISNQFFMTTLIGSISLFTNNNCAVNINGLISTNEDKSFIRLAEASPAPVPLRAASTRSATSQRVPPLNGSMFGKRDLASMPVDREQSSLSKAKRYNDIITEIIEEFMARNDEGDPDETTAAFCRMIVYECNKFSNQRKMQRPKKVTER